MPISFDGSNIGQVYAGGPIKEVYAGDQLVWQNAPWPKRGTWSGNTTATATTVASFTIPEAGVYNLEWAVTWGVDPDGFAMYRINSGSWVYGFGTTFTVYEDTVTGTSVTLAAGDVVSFGAMSFAGTLPATGAWTVTKT